MKSSSEPARRARWLWGAWALLTLVAIAVSIITGEGTRRAIFDRWQAISPRDLSSSDVEVVLIDSDSLAAVGSWPWPRYYMARLTEEIAARGATVIGYDILFSEPDRVRPDLFAKLYPELSAGAAAEVGALEPMDQQFGRVIGASPVVLARAGVHSGSGGVASLPIDVPISGSLPGSIPSWPEGISAIPELDDVALGHGLVNASPDSDGVIRAIPLVMRVAGQAMPGLALEIARARLEVSEIRGEPNVINLAERRIPVDEQARMLLHFGKFPSSKIVSAAELLKTGFPDQAYAGKIVLVGLSAEGTSDIVATPGASEEFGVLVQAQAIDTLLRGGWLERPRWAAAVEWGAALALAIAALGAVFAHRLVRIALAVAFAGVAVSTWMAFDSLGLLIDPVRPLLVGGGAVAGLVFG
ncbi:MAG TPA: CHASE2 domain-containing protein, partial [Sphingomicrobium sp.]|nr:CHASE2 domain-containing protein [Sphingomicrobium sp.]